MSPPTLSPVDLPVVELPSLDSQDELVEFVIKSLKEAVVSAEVRLHKGTIPIVKNIDISPSPFVDLYVDVGPDLKTEEGSFIYAQAGVSNGLFSLDNPIWLKGFAFWGWLDPITRIKTAGRPAVISDFCGDYFDVGDELKASPLGPLYPEGELKPVPPLDIWRVFSAPRAAGEKTSETVQGFLQILDKIVLRANIFARPEHQFGVCTVNSFSLSTELYLNFPDALELLRQTNFHSMFTAIGAGSVSYAENVDLTPLGDFFSPRGTLQRAKVSNIRVTFDPAQPRLACPMPLICDVIDEMNRSAPSERMHVKLFGIDFAGTVATSRGKAAVTMRGDLALTLDAQGNFQAKMKQGQVSAKLEALSGQGVHFLVNGDVFGRLSPMGEFTLDKVQLNLSEMGLELSAPITLPELVASVGLQVSHGRLDVDYDRNRLVDNLSIAWNNDLKLESWLPEGWSLQSTGETNGSIRMSYRPDGLFYLPETLDMSLTLSGELHEGHGVPIVKADNFYLSVQGLAPDSLSGVDERKLKISSSMESLHTPWGDLAWDQTGQFEGLYLDGLGRVGFWPEQWRSSGQWTVDGMDHDLRLAAGYFVNSDGTETVWNISLGPEQYLSGFTVSGELDLTGHFSEWPGLAQLIQSWQVQTAHPLELSSQTQVLLRGASLSGGYDPLVGLDLQANAESLLDKGRGELKLYHDQDSHGDFLQTDFQADLNPIHLGKLELRGTHVKGNIHLPPTLADYVAWFQGDKSWTSPFWLNATTAMRGALQGNMTLRPRGRWELDVAKRELNLRLAPGTSRMQAKVRIDQKVFQASGALMGRVLVTDGADGPWVKLRNIGLENGKLLLLGEEVQTLLANHFTMYLENPTGWDLEDLPDVERDILNLGPGRFKIDGDFNMPAWTGLLPPERPVSIKGAEFVPAWKVFQKLPVSLRGAGNLLRTILYQQYRSDKNEQRRQEKAQLKQRRIQEREGRLK